MIVVRSTPTPPHRTPQPGRLRTIESLGYRVGISEQGGRWIATAKRDTDGQFHVSKTPSELEGIDGLLASLGISNSDEISPQ